VTTASTPYSFAVPPGFPTSNTYALDSNSYTVIGSYVGSAQYTCTNHVLSAPTSQSCNQILCDVATDASGSFAPCSGVCANGGTPYPACPYPPGVDLTSPFPPNFAAPVTAYIGVPINLKGWVSNNWVSDTPTGFNNFFQPQEDSSIVLGSVINTPVLLGFDIREFTNTYTPSASDVAGMGALAATFASTGVATFNYRLCVDKSSPGDTGLVAERDENNNCGNYSTITLHACANNAINNPACNQCPAGLAWNGATCIPCDNGGCTGAGGNPTTPLGSLVCINGANNPTQCNQCPANLAWDTGTHSCVPCGGGACTGTVGGSSGDPVGNLVCNDGPQATPPTCSFYAANPSPCYILDGANSCLTDLTWSAKFSVIDISDFTWIVHDQTTRNVAGLSSTVMYGGTTFSLPNYWGGLLVADGPSSIFVDGLCLVGSVYDAGNTNTCIASGAPFPDLTIGVTDKTSFDIGQATVVTASITNIGNANAVGSFSTIFQVSTGSNGTGAVTDYPATTINSISSAASKTTQHTFTFIAGQTGSMRACADTPNPGTINESNEGNNCSGAWTDFSVTGCPVGTQWDTMNSACVNPQVGTYIVVNDYYPPGSLDFTCLGSTDYTILNTSVVPTAVVVGTTSYSGSVSYATSSEAQYQVRCLSGSVADSKPLYYHATPGTTIINIIATPKTIAPTEKITLSWDTKFPDNTCALTAKVVCANNACNVGQAAEQVRLSAILAATTTDSNDPFGPSRNLQSAVKTVAPGHTTTDFKALGRKTLSVKYTTDFTYDCGVRGKETKRVQVTRSEEQ
jgi:hypothetical protein